MKTALTRIWLCLVFGLAADVVSADDLAWLTDLPKAQAQANAEKKSVLLVFHGSDWCPPCIELQRQVFQSPGFVDYARKALVLVDVDFPEASKQSAELKQANLALKAKFNVGDNYPALVLLNAAGETVFQETGYFGGGPSEVLSKLQRHAAAATDAAVSGGFRNVGVEEFARLAADKQNMILDVRTPREFASGHLQGALNVDVNAPDFAERIKALDKNKTYLVHCASGVRSTRACENLARLDFPRLYNLAGGIKAWIKAGEPIEK
ncbi:MAG: rhodanese-like domain-containing protein [Limisphaerales bacterium]